MEITISILLMAIRSGATAIAVVEGVIRLRTNIIGVVESLMPRVKQDPCPALYGTPTVFFRGEHVIRMRLLTKTLTRSPRKKTVGVPNFVPGKARCPPRAIRPLGPKHRAQVRSGAPHPSIPCGPKSSVFGFFL